MSPVTTSRPPLYVRRPFLAVLLLLLPLLVPLLIGAASASEPLLRGDQAPEDLGRFLALLGAYDAVFVLIAIAVFDFLLDD